MKKSDLPVIFLHPGEVHFSKSPEVVTTVLGSCISITMFVRRLKLSAISHAVMPEVRECEQEKSLINPHKYVNTSIENMIGMFSSFEVDKAEIEVKLFGGANQLGLTDGKRSDIPIGEQNIRSALDTLREYNLQVSASDLGGNSGRKIFFLTDTGEILLKRFKKRKLW